MAAIVQVVRQRIYPLLAYVRVGIEIISRLEVWRRITPLTPAVQGIVKKRIIARASDILIPLKIEACVKKRIRLVATGKPNLQIVPHWTETALGNIRIGCPIPLGV
jgi:hypothetical protein